MCMEKINMFTAVFSLQVPACFLLKSVQDIQLSMIEAYYSPLFSNLQKHIMSKIIYSQLCCKLNLLGLLVSL